MVSAVAVAATTLPFSLSKYSGWQVIGGVSGIDITFGNNARRKFARTGSTSGAAVKILCVENHK
jgi:hypothetical protein